MEKICLDLEFMLQLSDQIIGGHQLRLQPPDLVLRLLVALQQLLTYLGRQLQIFLLLLQEASNCFHIMVGPGHLGESVTT